MADTLHAYEVSMCLVCTAEIYSRDVEFKDILGKLDLLAVCSRIVIVNTRLVPEVACVFFTISTVFNITKCILYCAHICLLCNAF